MIFTIKRALSMRPHWFVTVTINGATHDLGLLDAAELGALADACKMFADDAIAEIGAEIGP